MQVTVAPTRATRAACLRGDCSARTPGLFPWVMFWVLIDSNWFRLSDHKRGWFVRVHFTDLHCPVLQIQGINLEIGMSRKRKPLPPRHKRLTRQGRLQAGKRWLRSYPGKNIARGYRKHFGVDSLCAIRELRLLGVAIDPAYERAVLAASRARNKKRKREEKFLISEETFYGFASLQDIPPEVRHRYHYRGNKIPHRCGSFVFRRNALYVGRRSTLLGRT